MVCVIYKSVYWVHCLIAPRVLGVISNRLAKVRPEMRYIYGSRFGIFHTKKCRSLYMSTATRKIGQNALFERLTGKWNSFFMRQMFLEEPFVGL
jgi:hypothetical protein